MSLLHDSCSEISRYLSAVGPLDCEPGGKLQSSITNSSALQAAEDADGRAEDRDFSQDRDQSTGPSVRVPEFRLTQGTDDRSGHLYLSIEESIPPGATGEFPIEGGFGRLNMLLAGMDSSSTSTE